MNSLNNNINPFYDSYWISKFMNKFLKHGRKKISEKNIYKGFVLYKKQTQINPVFVLLKSLTILKPILNLKPYIKLKKKNQKLKYFIPVQIKELSSFKIALIWFYKLIIEQKKHRKLHRYITDQTLAKKQNKTKKTSKSKKKIFSDRFHVALKNQELYNLINSTWISLTKDSHKILKNKKFIFYILATKSRLNSTYRWI